jgi:hypothetical protein
MKLGLLLAFAFIGSASAQSLAPITVTKLRNPGFGIVLRISPKVGSVDIRRITVDRGRCTAVSSALMGNEGVLSSKLPYQLGLNRWIKVDVFGVACPGYEVQVETGTESWEFRLE